jgi:ATP-dependent protease ClpP protease subunit
MSSLKGRAAGVSAALIPHFRAAVKEDDILEMCVYEEIGENFWTGGGVTADSVKKVLDEADEYDRIAVRINSPGGDAFEGIAIRSLLRSQSKPVDVYIDGVAASAASIIAMAGDTITMATGSMMMIHNAWSMCVGNARDMRQMATTLDAVDGSIAQVYVDRTKKPLEDVKALMDAESWMSADECLEKGFATNVSKHEDKSAMALGKKFKNLVEAKRPKDIMKALKDLQTPLTNKSKGDSGPKTKRVDGEDLTWDDFVIALDHDDPDTWHLPWHFSSIEKTKAHLRDALARFNQVEGLTTEQKHEAYTKLVHLCKKYGIHVSEKDGQRFEIWSKTDGDDDYDTDDDTGDEEEVGADEDMECMCECDACMDGDCMNCTMENCMDAVCKEDGCPMQAQDDDEDGDGDGDGDAMDASATNVTTVKLDTSAVSAAIDAAIAKAKSESEPEESNLSQYEARLRILGIK